MESSNSEIIDIVRKEEFEPLDDQTEQPLAGSPAPIFDADGALSREFLLERGYCCGNRCRNCPYGWEAVE